MRKETAWRPRRTCKCLACSMVRAPAPLPTVESLVRCAVSLTYVILLRLCGRRCPANLCEWWESPGVVLDDLRAMMARAHES